MKKAKAWVRIIVTVAFAAAFILGFLWNKEIPSEAFVALATAVIIWWFKDRSDAKKDVQVQELTKKILELKRK